MMSNLKTLNKKMWLIFLSPPSQLLLRLALMTTLLLLWQHAFASDDPLDGTDSGLTATLGSSGTGRKFIYLIEGVVAISTYIKTKNLLMFSGVVAIAVFLNILFKVAGITTG